MPLVDHRDSFTPGVLDAAGFARCDRRRDGSSFKQALRGFRAHGPM
jgi:hypothetical protein